MQELRYAFRKLRREPGFAAVAVLTLALGIGAATAAFSAVDAVLLRPPPYTEPDRLVLLWHRSGATGSGRLRISAPDVAEFREQSTLFRDFAFVASPRDALLGAPAASPGPAPVHARLGRVSPNLFSVLGVTAAVGRMFRPGESVLPPEALADSAPPPPPGVVVLSHRLWRQRFGADPEVVGRTVRVDGAAMRVVGVLESDFELLLPGEAGVPPAADAWTPLRFPLSRFRRAERLRDQDSDNTGAVIGRLRRGVTLARAREEMARVAAGQRREVAFYDAAEMGIAVVPMLGDAVARARPALLALGGAVVLVLLIACMNVSNLLLARAAGREGELAIRRALGAGRGRLARQLLTEAGVLGALGAAAGLAVAYWCVELFDVVAPAGVPRLESAAVDAPVLAFALGTAVAATLLAGGLPSLLAARFARRGALRVRNARARRPSLRRALVVSQVALCLSLLAGTGLLFRSFAGLQRVDPGFRPEGLLTFRATLPPGSVGGPAARAELMDRLLARVRAVPGVRSAGLVGGLPLGGGVWTQPYGVGERPLAGGGTGDEANFRVITSDYFRAMGTRLLAGRSFTAEENLVEARRVVIVDATLARSIAAGGDAVGRELVFPLDGDPVRAEVVGVVEPVRHADLRHPGRETLYVPYRQEASRDVTVAVRVLEGGEGAMLAVIRRAAGEFAAAGAFPVYDFRPMSAYVERTLAPDRFALSAFAALGLSALFLAALGLYGLLAEGVARRTREIGVRKALGASDRGITRRFLRQGLLLVAVGLASGWVLSLAMARVTSGLLYGVSPADPLTHLTCAAVLSAAGAAACLVPAIRASRVDPAVALRVE